MGRTNGKLVPFLRNGLMNASYINLKYQDVESEVFFIKLPRYNEKLKLVEPYERMLVDWYKFGEKEKKYESYSKAKAVFQASLKKSLYLVKLPTMEKKLLFRFATKEEIKEKRRLLKEKAIAAYNIPEVMLVDQSIVANDLFTVRGPPSVCSSGYHSAEDIEEPILNSDLNKQENNSFSDIDDAFINQMLDDILEKTGSEVFNDLKIDDPYAKNDCRETNQPCMDDLKNIQLDDLKLSSEDLQENLVAPTVVELNATQVGVSEFPTKKLYWSCSRKLIIDSTLQLICERKVIEAGTNILEGLGWQNTILLIGPDMIVIPKEVWEPGISYVWLKNLEVEGKMYIFLSFNSV